MPEPMRLEDDSPEGRYSNYFRVGHNAYEVVLDFGQSHPPEREYIHTRIVISPPGAKELSEVLRKALEEYERRYPYAGY
jgi:hypothetical protein